MASTSRTGDSSKRARGTPWSSNQAAKAKHKRSLFFLRGSLNWPPNGERPLLPELQPSTVTSVPGHERAMAGAPQDPEDKTLKEAPEVNHTEETGAFTRVPQGRVEVKGGRNIGQERHPGKAVKAAGRRARNRPKDKPSPVRSPSAEAR